MRLTPPKNVTWWIAVFLGAIGLLGQFVPVLQPFSFWLCLVGLVLLALAGLIKGL